MSIILCDGDCGNYYDSWSMSMTHDGQSMCKECMFTFMAELDRIEEHEEYLR